MSEIVIYGSGKTGKSLAKLLHKLGKCYRFYDDEHGFSDYFGVRAANESENKCEKKAWISSENDLWILSPGIRPDAAGIHIAENLDAEIVSELDFCFPLCKSPCISVTGTNGKTTTCQLIYHILRKSGRSARLLGNGGVPFSEEVTDCSASEIVVLESSSFQLNGSKLFAPYISVVTNVAQDHLDYHKNFDAYVGAKCNNFLHQSDDSFAIFNIDDALSLSLAEKSRANTLFYSVANSSANCFYSNKSVVLRLPAFHKSAVAAQSLDSDDLLVERTVFCPFIASLLKHNLSNVLCAITVCVLLGVEPEVACKAVETYHYLPHRLQTVAQLNGIAFVDDSKATNVHATLSALSCYESIPLALILGGSDKGCDFDEIFCRPMSNVKVVYAVGETAEKIAISARKYGVSVQICENYRQAVKAGYYILRNFIKRSANAFAMSDNKTRADFQEVKNADYDAPIAAVLMSNACASFDMFSGYAERGELFAELAVELCHAEKN